MTDFMFSQQKMCPGCSRISGWDSGSGFKCHVYKTPYRLVYVRRREFCPFNPPVMETKKSHTINPLKASKRGKRG